MSNLIVIPLDFSEGNKTSSYYEVLERIKDKEELIYTHCLNFFDFSILDKHYDVKVIKSDDSYILLSELLNNDGSYTNKIIRQAHNVMRLLIAGHFEFKSQWIPNLVRGID